MLIKLLLLQVIQHCDSIILVSKEIQFPSVSHSSSSGDGGTHPAVSHKDNLSVGSWKNSEEEVLYCSSGLDLIKGRSHPSIISFHDQECSPQLFDVKSVQVELIFGRRFQIATSRCLIQPSTQVQNCVHSCSSLCDSELPFPQSLTHRG